MTMSASRLIRTAAILATLVTATSAWAGPPVSQLFFVPMPEGNIRTSAFQLYSGTGTTINTVVSIVANTDGTIIYYDHWEDGYEADLANPVQATTETWGDNNPANGIPPGFAVDILDSGAVVALENTMTVPRNPADIRYDGRDRFGSTLAISATRASWATTPGTVLAGAVSIYDTSRYGTDFEVPVGQDVAAGDQLFEYTSLMIMASQNTTTVDVDIDGNGSTDVTQLLNRGETLHIDGGVLSGGTVTSTKPVQVDILTGDIGARYEWRWYPLFPSNEWTTAYHTPVGSASNADPTHVFLYNPGAAPITVDIATRAAATAVIVPAGGTVQYQMPINSGGRFTTANPADDFFALSTVDSDSGNNLTHDWGFALVPDAALTTTAVVGWGPGTDGLSANGSPVWVTAVEPTEIYVDYDGDPTTGPLTDPNLDQYDLLLEIAQFESIRVFDPDNDQTGMRLYTLDGTLITAAWGQDADTAAPGNPFLDMGTTVLPLPIARGEKNASLIIDNDMDGLPDGGDTLEYSIAVINDGLSTLGSVVVFDEVPTNTTYIPGSTTIDAVPVVDDPVPPFATEFPLDESGLFVPAIPPQSSRIVTFQVLLDNPLPPGTTSITNQATIGTDQGPLTPDEEVPVDTPTSTACALELSDAGFTPVFFYVENDTVFVQLDDADQNIDPLAAESVTIVIRNLDTGDRETLTATETGIATGVFQASVASSTTAGIALEDGTLNGSAGDTVQASYTDQYLPSDVCTDSVLITGPQVTKPLYLSDPAQGMDRIDPVAAGDVTTSTSSALSASSGTVTVSGAVTTGTVYNDTVLTFSHSTGAGTDRLLLVGVSYECQFGTCGSPANVTISSVTFGGTPLTLVGTSTVAGADSGVSIWRLFNPPASTTANVVVNKTGGAADFGAGAVTFAGVDQAQDLNTTYVGTAGSGTSASVVVSSAADSLVFDTVSTDDIVTVTVGAGQTERWNINIAGGGAGDNDFVGAGSTEPGAASVTMSWGFSGASDYALGAISVAPTAGAPPSTTFTQTTPFGDDFDMPAGGSVTATFYVNVTAGVLPALPDVEAEIRDGAGTIITLTNPTFGGGILTFGGVLPANRTVLAGEQIEVEITSNEAGATFEIQYDSTTAPSQIGLPTTSAIAVESIEIYDAPFPGGSLLTGALNGQTVYVRTTISDPFGPSDITSADLTITDPSLGTIVANLTDVDSVATTASSKTYEYAWTTGAEQGTYNIEIVANEGTEGIFDSSSIDFPVSFQDLGTDCEANITENGGVVVDAFPSGSDVCAQVTDLDQNTDGFVVENVTVALTSDSGDSEDVVLTETGANTGVFFGCVPSDPVLGAGNNNGTLLAAPGDVVQVTYTDIDDAGDVCIDPSIIATPAPAVVITKTRVTPASGTALAGDTVRFDLLVSNPGPTELSTVTLTDEFESACLAFSSSNVAPDTVAPDTPVVGQTTITWNNVGPIASGNNTTIQVFFTATGLAACSPTVNSSSVSGTDEFATPVSDGPDTATVTVTNPAVAVTKTLLTGDPSTVGATITYEITIDNVGNSDIATLPLTDIYSNFCHTFDSAVPAPDGAGGGTIFWADLGPLAIADPPIVVTVNFTAAAGCDPATNTAIVDSATDTGGNPVPEDQDSATVVIPPIIDLVIDKADASEPAGAGLDHTYTITVTNDGPSDATNVVVTDVLDPDTTFVSDTAPGGCVEAPPGTLTCTIGAMAEDDIVSFDVTVSVSALAPVAGSLETGPCDGSEDICNNVSVTATETETDPGNNTADEPTDVVPPPNLAITKSDSPDSAARGGVLVYTLLVENNGIGDATGVTVIDDIDPNTTYVSDTASGGCIEAPVGTLTCDIGSIPAGGSTAFTITVNVSAVAPIAGVLQSSPCDGSEDLCNLASVSSTEPDSDPSDNSTDEPTDVVPGANLSIDKVDLTDPINPPSNLTYTVTVSNTGPSAATNVVVVDVLDSNTTYVSDTGGCVEAPVGTLTCNLGGIANGGSTSFDVTVNVGIAAPDGGSLSVSPCDTSEDLCNNVSVSADEPDPDLSDNTADEPTDVVRLPDLAISKSDAPDAVAQGGLLTYTLQVDNNGIGNATNVTVVDVLDADTTYVSDTASGGCVEAPAGTLTCDLGGILAGGSTSFTITVSVSGAAPVGGTLQVSPCDTSEDLCNNASVTSDLTDANPADNSTDEPTDVVPGADVSIDKTDLADPVVAGTNLTYTVTVTNAGPSVAANVVVTDVLDASTTYVSDTAGCVEAPAGTLTCNLGALAVGATSFDVTVAVDLAAPTAGTLSVSPCDGSEDLCNDVSVTSDEPDPDLTNNTADEPTNVLAPTTSDLQIVKGDTIEPVQQGGLTTYQIAVLNNGPDDATNVVITDTLDPDQIFQGSSVFCTEAPVGTITCDIGDLASGELRIIEIGVYVDFTAPTAGTKTSGPCDTTEDTCNTVSVTSDGFDPTPGNNTDDEPTDVIPAPATSVDLSVTKSDDPDPVSPGDTFTYTIDVLNFAFDDATNVEVIDWLDPDTTYVSDTAPGGCVESPVGRLSCDLGTVTAFTLESFTITVSVSPTADTASTLEGPDCDGTEDLCNTVLVRSDDAADTNPNNNSDSEPTNVLPPTADLRITKTDDNDPVEAGGFVTYTLSVTNDGPNPATNVVVVDTLDANTTYVTDTAGCVEAPVGTLTCALGTIASGATSSFDVTINVNAGAPTAGTTSSGLCADAGVDICNSATVSSDVTDPDPSDDTAEEPTNVVPPTATADLSVVKTESSGDPAPSNSDLTYTLTVTNAGPDTAINVVVLDSLDANTTYVSDTASGGCVESPTGELACSLGDIPPGVVAFDVVVHIEPTAPTAGTTTSGACSDAGVDICNQASVFSDTPDDDPTNNTDEEPTDVTTASADISVSKVDAGDPAARGGSVTYTVTVTNAGPSIAEGVIVVDTLDAETTYVSDTAPSGCVEAPAGTLTCSIGDVAVGSVAFDITVTVDPTAPTAGALSTSPCDGSEDLCNNVVVTASTADPNLGDNSDDEPTDVQPSADLAITKEDTPDPVVEGDNILYTITVENLGADTATNVTVVDTLAAFTTYVSDTGGCVEAPVGTLTCNVGALASGASTSFFVTVSVDAGAPTAGSLRNSPCTGAEDLCNNASVSSDQPDPDPSNNTADEPTDVSPSGPASLQIVKEDSPDTVEPGGTLTYTLHYSNISLLPIDNVVIEETYDPGVSFVTASPLPDIGNSQWTLGTLAAGETGSITITVIVDPGAVDGDVLVNNVSISGDGVPPDTDEEETTVSQPGPTTALLRVTKSVTPQVAPSSGLLTYTFTVFNEGQATSYDTIVTDDLPLGTTYANANPEPDTIVGSTLAWAVGDLAPGAGATFTVYALTDADLPAGTLIENCAVANGAVGPGTISSAGLTGEGCAVSSSSGPGTDCTLVMKKRSVGVPVPGGDVVYRCLWCDPCKDAPSVRISDFLPDEVTLVSVSTKDVDAVLTPDGDVELTIVELPAGRAGLAHIRVRINEDVPPGTVITNVITMSDAALRQQSGIDVMVVRAGKEDVRENGFLQVTGPKRVPDGGRVSYKAKFNNIEVGSTVTMVLSEQIEPVFIFPPADQVNGNVVTWENIRRSSGKLLVKGQVNLSEPDAVGAIISAEVLATTPSQLQFKSGSDTAITNGPAAVASGTTVSSKRLSVDVAAPRYLRAGLETSVSLRYRNLQGTGNAQMNLPDGLAYVSSIPEPTFIEGGVLTWQGLDRLSGTAKVRVAVDESLPANTILTIGASITDDVGAAGTETIVTTR